MEALQEIGGVIGFLILAVFITTITVCALQWIWWNWKQGRINESYRKAIEAHEAAKDQKSKKTWAEIMADAKRLQESQRSVGDYKSNIPKHRTPPAIPVKKDFHENKFSERYGYNKKSYAPTGRDADRSEAFSSASALAGSFGSTSAEASDSLNFGAAFTPDPDPSPSNLSSFEGFGSGGDFGGGGSAGSWDSGSGSSYDSGSSDSGGSDSSWSD